MIKVLGYYVTKAGSLTFYTAGGKPPRGDAAFYSSRPVESLLPELLDLPLARISLKTNRGYYNSPAKLRKQELRAFANRNIKTLRQLLEYYQNPNMFKSPDQFRAMMFAAPFSLCPSGVDKIASILHVVTEKCSGILSAAYTPVVYFPVNIRQIALPDSFPVDLFNGKGPSPELVAEIQKVAEAELGRLVGPMILAAAEKLETEKIAKAQARLAKIKAIK